MGRPKRPQQGRLKDGFADAVTSELRASTMVQYLAKVQWCVRPAQVVDSPVVGGKLPVELGGFSVEAVRKVFRKRKCEKASGHVDIPSEYV